VNRTGQFFRFFPCANKLFACLGHSEIDLAGLLEFLFEPIGFCP
jgi:hypothetical protein